MVEKLRHFFNPAQSRRHLIIPLNTFMPYELNGEYLCDIISFHTNALAKTKLHLPMLLYFYPNLEAWM